MGKLVNRSMPLSGGGVLIGAGVALGLLLVCSQLLLSVPAGAAPQISGVNAPGSAGLYDIFEIKFSVSTVATNMTWPYDPAPPTSIPAGAGVTVEGLFSKDNWATTLTVPGFYYQEYTRELIRPNGEVFSDEVVEPVGAPGWRVRFAPMAQGAWKFRIRVTDASGTTLYPESGDIAFECTPSANKGFVRTSSTDRRYFETSDGTPLVGPCLHCGGEANTFKAEKAFANYKANGIQWVRYFMSFWAYQNPFGGSDSLHKGWPWWPEPGYEFAREGGARQGDRFSAKVSAGSLLGREIYLRQNIRYKFSVWMRLVDVAGAAGTGAVACIASTDNIPLQSTSPATGTLGWQEYTVQYTPAQSKLYKVMAKHTGSGGYLLADEFSVKSSTDGGATWSSERLSKGDFDTQNYVDLQEAWKVDRILDAAQTNDVYLQMVLGDKLDPSIGCIGYDGGTCDFHYANVWSASSDHPTRWLWKAWWRYCAARWAAYRSIGSWEPLSELDQWDPATYTFSNAFADYMHSFNANPHLASTSFQTNIPTQFWQSTSCDFLDYHQYFGTGSPGGARCYVWSDGLDAPPDPAVPDTLRLIPNWGNLYYDTGRNGGRSIKQVTYPGWTMGTGELAGEVGVALSNHIGVDPTHKYTLRFYAKAQNVDKFSSASNVRGPGILITWAASTWEAHDFIVCQVFDSSLGSYDWTLFEWTSTPVGPNPRGPAITPPVVNGKVPSTACINMVASSAPANGPTSSYWIDDLEFIDETTGERLFIGGDFEDARIDYDSALAVAKYGSLLSTYSAQYDKPAVWAETGIFGGGAVAEWPLVAKDTDGIHLKKLLWAHAGPHTPYTMYYFTLNIANNNLWRHFKAYHDFMADVPLNNGHYEELAAATDNPKLRVFGQKDLANSRAHLWIDNKPYNWKAVVDHRYSPDPWSSVTAYPKYATCGSGTPLREYRSLQDNNFNHPLTDTAWWQDMGVFNPANNPPLPAPVSGTVTVSGLRNGSYKAQWWDTTEGRIIRTDDVTCSGGKIVLSVQNLESDIACKINPLAPRILLNINVPSEQVRPGEVVTVTVVYSNAGDAPATNVAVKAAVPAQMDYVAGSAEASGGVYNPSDQSITWSVANLAVGQNGTRTFQARVSE